MFKITKSQKSTDFWPNRKKTPKIGSFVKHEVVKDFFLELRLFSNFAYCLRLLRAGNLLIVGQNENMAARGCLVKFKVIKDFFRGFFASS